MWEVFSILGNTVCVLVVELLAFLYKTVHVSVGKYFARPSQVGSQE